MGKKQIIIISYFKTNRKYFSLKISGAPLPRPPPQILYEK
jgi:hypothetical protein